MSTMPEDAMDGMGDGGEEPQAAFPLPHAVDKDVEKASAG